MSISNEDRANIDRALAAGASVRESARITGVPYGQVRGYLARKQKVKVAEPPEGSAAILIYDIETAPALAWMWSAYNANIIDIEQDWYLLSFAYQWYGSDEIHFVSITQDQDFFPDSTDDRYVAERLHALFDRADITVAHNGDRFDKRKANARFLYHGIDPPSPYRTVDTAKVARKYFSNYRNSLKDLGRQYVRADKMVHHGFELWRDCMRGDTEAWDTMEKYNRKDIEVLEQLYTKLRPWIENAPNQALITGRPDACPICGATTWIKRGFRYSRTRKNQLWQCNPTKGGCGGYSISRISEKEGIPERK